MKTKITFSWANLPPYQKIAYVCGFLVMLTGLAHLVAFPFIDEAQWSGPAGFRKTIVFGLSAGLTLVSMGWLLRFFDPKPRLHTIMMSAMSLALVIEIVIIDLQRFRGVPSHFNMSTPFDSILWTAMGLSILVFATVSTLQAILSFGRMNATPSMALAIRTSMILFFLSQLSGQLIVKNGMSLVLDGNIFLMENVAISTTYGEAGNLKLPHAIALHAIQALPLLGLILLRTRLSEASKTFWVALCFSGFLGISLLAQIQAYKGKAIHDLDTLSAMALGASVFAFTIPYLQSMIALVSDRLCLSRENDTIAAHPTP